MVSGPWRQTGLAEVFREARDSRHGDVAFVDFQYYEPSEGAPAAFVAGPIFEDDGELLGVLAFQVSPERINEEMHYTDGMGETGETFIVGDDLLMRSDSRFSDTSAVLERTVDTEPVRRALAGESSVDRSIDYRGVEVLSAYGPVDFEGARWAVIADIELEEVLRPARMLRRNIFLTGLFVIVLLALAGAVAPGPLTRNQ
ncbi:MAG: cache domain-containing protein [Gemmatimonadota bacterium]|nr:MAG: cache domain-containing protein [Gemmatimonadota bacterium]